MSQDTIVSYICTTNQITHGNYKLINAHLILKKQLTFSDVHI